MREDSEYILHQLFGDDDSAKARHHDNEEAWTIESYDARVTKRMIELGAQTKASKIDGNLFIVDAKLLIEFIAESSGLNVEFRKRKRQQLSESAMAAKRARMSELRSRQLSKV